MEANEGKQQHLLFAILLGIAGLLIILIFVTLRSQGDTNYTATTSGTVTNASPTVDSILITTTTASDTGAGINLTENSTTNVFVNGTYTDSNGCDEVNTSTGNIVAKLYRSGATGGAGCTANNADCYSITSSSCSFTNCTAGGSDVAGRFSCTFAVQYYADPTDSGSYSANTWLAVVTTTDKNSAAGASTTPTGQEINTLTAVGLGTDGLGANISYGSLALGATSGSDVSLAFKNTGNKTIGVTVLGTALTCTVGTVGVGQQKYATSSGVAYGSMTALTGSAVNIGASVAKATQSADATSTIYWKIQLPSTGISGTCTGSNTVASV